MIIGSVAVGGLAVDACAAPATLPRPEHGFFQRLAEGKKQTVVVYGTSLSHGGAWVPAMEQWFSANYPGLVSVANSSGPGQNSTWGLRNIDAKVLALHPDLVLIEFSYNDAVDRFKLPVDQAATNLREMIRRIRGHNPDAVIVLQTMNVGWDAPNGRRSASIRADLTRYTDNYRTCATDLGIPLVDHEPQWQRLKDSDPDTFHAYVPDGSHPSKEASLAITWPALQAWLEQTRDAATATDHRP